jgi:hypothetical protein
MQTCSFSDSIIEATSRLSPTSYPPPADVLMIDALPLEDRVLTALTRNPYLPGRTLRFEAAEGRVTLRGVVGTYFQKQMAQEALRHVAGIEEIANELEVSWS